MIKHIKYRIVSFIYKYIENFAHKLRDLRERLNWTEEAIKRLGIIGGGYNGSNKEYKSVVLGYWKKYGVRPDKLWYDLYCNGQKSYNPRFIPDSIWFVDILPYFNNKKIALAYNDKALFNKLLRGVRKPETIVKKMGGYFYNGDGEQIISRAEAENLCRNEEHLIIKPGFGMKGKGMAFYDLDSKDKKDISGIFDEFPKDFVVQRIVKQHPDLARLSETSLNTIRVVSFHFQGKVHILSALLRIGKNGSRVDNVSAGGSACPIKPDGWLYEKSVNRQSQWTDCTPDGIKYKDIQIPNYSGIIDKIKELHCQLPYFNILGWDFAVNNDNEPVLIEFNTKPGQNQISCGPTFGDITDEVLEEVFIKRTFNRKFHK